MKKNNKKNIETDKLSEQERLSTIGQLMGGLTHNLSTPILGTSGQLMFTERKLNKLKSVFEDNKIKEEEYSDILCEIVKHIENIHYYNRYMADVVGAIKSHMKSSENIKKQNFSIKDLFDKVSILTSFEFKHNKINVNYNIGKDVDTKVVFGEFTILLQVIVNIIENAVDSYNGEAGELYLDSFLTEKENKNYIVIKVEDKGSGIKEDVLEKLLNQMYTTKGSKGTGIGLYLSNILLKSKFGGFLEIESEIGEGTKVFVYVEDAVSI